MSDGMEHLGTIARAVVDKVAAEIPSMHGQFGTVTSVRVIAGQPTVADVHIDGDPADSTVAITSLIGDQLYTGLRVYVVFDPPQGAYIMGSLSSGGVPMARAGLCLGNGGGGG